MIKILKHLWRLAVLWFALGICYVTLELIFRGATYLPMLWVGGLCGLCAGLLNQHSFFRNRRMWLQCLIGTAVTLIIEYISGYILNIRLGLKIWDYSGLPFNLNGQICLLYAVVWFFLMPLAVYLDDWLRWKLFDERRPRKTLLREYEALFTGR